jgi:hypothetical protein
MNKFYLCCNCGNEIEDEMLPEICPFCAAGKEDIMEQTEGFFFGDSEFDEDDDDWLEEEE